MKRFFPFDQDKQELAKERSERRRSQMQQRREIENADPKPSQTHTTQLLRLRESTVQATLVSLSQELPATTATFERTTPLSNDPNFGHLRHDAGSKARVVAERNDESYHVGPQTPVRKIQAGQFQSPNKTVYGYGHTVLTVETPGGTRDRIRPLRANDAGRQLSFLGDVQSRISEVQLSFNNLSRPSGKSEPINNKKAQGGFSADELFAQQCEYLKNELLHSGLATQAEIEEYFNNTPHFEHTHLIAAHFGRVKNIEGQTVDPRDPKSTFVAPAALNTEMMLFEKFADFLVYINHKHHGHAAHEKTVDYTCKVLLAQDTTIAVGLELQITDRHTGIVFSQTWDSPYAVTEKPSMQLYITLLQALKDGLNRQLDNNNNHSSQRPKI